MKIEEVDFESLTESLTLYAKLTLKIIDKALLNDLVQDALVVVLQKFDKFDGKSINAWAQRILHIEYYKYVQSSIKNMKKNKGASTQIKPNGFSLDESFLSLVMSILSPLEQEYVQAKYLDGLSVPELSNKMGMSKTSMHVFGKKIMEKLRSNQSLEDYNPEQ